MASIVYLKGRVAGERLETEIARGVSSTCKLSGFKSGHRTGRLLRLKIYGALELLEH